MWGQESAQTRIALATVPQALASIGGLSNVPPMPWLFHIILAVHVGAGIVALTSFWGAVFAEKGSVLHRRFGHVFSIAIYVLVTEALFLYKATALDATIVEVRHEYVPAEAQSSHMCQSWRCQTQMTRQVLILLAKKTSILLAQE